MISNLFDTQDKNRQHIRGRQTIAPGLRFCRMTKFDDFIKGSLLQNLSKSIMTPLYILDYNEYSAPLSPIS